MSNAKMALVPLEDLPATAVVTGKAYRDNGRDSRDDWNGESVVLEFRRERIGAVNEKLKGVAFTRIEITDLNLQADLFGKPNVNDG